MDLDLLSTNVEHKCGKILLHLVQASGLPVPVQGSPQGVMEPLV